MWCGSVRSVHHLRLWCSSWHRVAHFSTGAKLNQGALLSANFACEEAWNARLNSEYLKKLDLQLFFSDLKRKFSREQRGSAIDIDLFVNASEGVNESELDMLEELLYQFRRTPQTCLMLPSTTFGTVRVFVKAGKTDTLMRILNDRLNFGLFVDTYTSIFLMDHFITLEKWRDAAKVAVLMMLQEELDSPLASELALYSCFKYASTWSPEPWEPQLKAQEQEPEDEVKVWKGVLDPDYNDEHFDLTQREHLVGKTLVQLCKNKDTLLDRSLHMLGLCLFEKWDTLSSLVNSDKEVVSSILDQMKSIVENENSKAPATLPPFMTENLKGVDVDVETDLVARVKSAIQAHEEAYIDKQKSLLQEWNEIRDREVERQMEQYMLESRKDAIAKKREEMEEREERLFFFDKLPEFEEYKEEELRKWRKTLPRRKGRITLKPKEKLADDYVPPEIRSGSR